MVAREEYRNRATQMSMNLLGVYQSSRKLTQGNKPPEHQEDSSLDKNVMKQKKESKKKLAKISIKFSKPHTVG